MNRGKTWITLQFMALAVGAMAFTGCSELASSHDEGDAITAGARTEPGEPVNHGRPSSIEQDGMPDGPGVGRGSIICGDSGEIHR